MRLHPFHIEVYTEALLGLMLMLILGADIGTCVNSCTHHFLNQFQALGNSNAYDKL